MAGVSDTEDRSYDMGMHTEQLSGRTQQIFFSPEDEENFVYPWLPRLTTTSAPSLTSPT